MKALKNNKLFILLKYNKFEFISLFIIIGLTTLLINSIFMNINIDNKLRFEENKEKIYENLTKPDPSKFYSDMKIERVRDIIKENKNGSYSIDILNLMVLGFDNITSAKLFSKNKTSLESNNIKAKLLTSHWSDNKWWSKNKTEYLKYLD